MKYRISSYVWQFLLTASLFLTACSGEDSIDDLLSRETTPVTFELGLNSPYYFFDYAGSCYVGSDTIWTKSRKMEVNLRQGKHHLLWFTGLWVNENSRNSYIDDLPCFNPATQIVTAMPCNDISYAECDINVLEYLLPTQKMQFHHLTTKMVIEITDATKEGVLEQTSRLIELHGFPVIIAVPLRGNDYRIYDNGINLHVLQHNTEYLDDNGYLHEYVQELCPFDGLDNIQLSANVYNTDGRSVPTTPLPVFSLRRGYTTVLSGPLFSGSTSDWTVKMEPYAIN